MNTRLCGSRRKYALGKTIEQQSVPGGRHETDMNAFLARREQGIRETSQSAIDRHRSVKYYIKMEISFRREVDDSVHASRRYS